MPAEIYALTSTVEAGAEIVSEVEGVFDGDCGQVPHFLKLGQFAGRAHAHDEVLVVEVVRVVGEEADPELGDRRPVGADAARLGRVPRPRVVQTVEVGVVPGIPAVNSVAVLSVSSVQFLEEVDKVTMLAVFNASFLIVPGGRG